MFNRYVDGLATTVRPDQAAYEAAALVTVNNGYLPAYLPAGGSRGGGNDVVAATTSSDARRCGNDVVGRVAGAGSGGDEEAGGAGPG